MKCQLETTVDPEGSDNNPYNPTPGTPGSSSTLELELEGINLWINGTGKISAKAPFTQKANDVVMNGGELSGFDIAGNVTLDGTTTISDADIAGNVTVKGGEATISNGDIAGDVTVEAGSITISNGDVKSITANGAVTMSNGDVAGDVTLTSGESNFANVNIYGTLTIEAAATANMSNDTNAIKVNKINNKGKLTSTSDINVVDIIADNCVIYLESTENAKDKVIWYSNNFEQIDGIELRGRILPVSATAFKDELDDVKAGETIVLKSDLTLTDWTSLNPNGVAYILDLNGNTLTITKNNAYGYENATKNITVKNGKIVGPMFVKDITVKFENIVFETLKANLIAAYQNLGIVYLASNADVTFEKCTFKTDGRPFETEGGIKKLVVNNCTIEDCGGNAIPYVNPLTSSKAKVEITNSVFELALGCELYGIEKRFTVTGNTFENTFGFAAAVSDVNALSSACKTFCNNILTNNTFKGANKIDVWSTTLSSSLYVNAGF